MPITFHCECCKKKIKAPEGAGGKWGTCPFCNHKCYVPSLASADEPELKLAPLDESHETNYDDMMRESGSLTKEILQETGFGTEEDFDSDVGISEREVLKLIINYLRCMADGRIDKADEVAEKIGHAKDKAIDLLTRMSRTERPEPELQDIPPKVLLKFIKGLRTRLGK